MRAHDLLADLRQRGVTLEADSDRFSVDAPAGMIDERLRKELAENKPALIRLLQWERRRLREAEQRGLIIEWSREHGWIALHDPSTGEWHEVKASECLAWVVDAANSQARRRRGGTR